MIRRVRTKRGLTLVELLVVVGVASVIAAVMLPGIKSVLTDRKSSQAAIMVRNYIEAARTRAVGRNRSVAVVFERLSSRAGIAPNGMFVSETAQAGPYQTPDANFVPYNACVRMSLAEEPLPVSEAMLPAAVTFRVRQPGDEFSPSIPTAAPYIGEDSLLDMHQGNVQEARIFEVTASSNINLAWLVGEYLTNGSQISFGNSPRRFSIVTPRSPTVHGNAGGGTIWFSVMNEKLFDGHIERAKEPYVDLKPGTEFKQFKIYQRPKPVFSQVVQLPRGMCVDLSLSGFGKKMPGQGALPPEKQPVFDPTGSAMAGFDYRVRFASDWIGNEPTPPEPWQLRPVYIVFSPEGQLSHVWANDRRTPGDRNYQGNLTRIDATQDVFLHVGKIDRVAMPLDPDPRILGRNAFGLRGAIQLGVQNNLTDLSAYVVRLSPSSGAISASPIVSIDTQISILGLNVNNLNFGDMVELSRRGTYNSNVTAQ
ncbi:MAG: prepilin-type N-terminal cleavage/methylation domain-containing protein [Pirellula sp.]